MHRGFVRTSACASVMPGMGGDVDAKVGVITAAEVNMPSVAGGSKMFSKSAPSTWALVWVVLAVFYLLAVI